MLAAFGAAFLVARAVVQSPAKAATTQAQTLPMPHVRPVGRNRNAELVSQFAPVTAVLKRLPKHKRKSKVAHHVSAPISSGSASVPQTYTPPVNTVPLYTPPPATSSPQPTHKRSSSSGGSGTTTIG